LENPDSKPGPDRSNGTGDLTGLVDLLTAAEARIARLEKQIEGERVRMDEARTEADRLRAGLIAAEAGLTTQTDRADEAVKRAEAAEKQVWELRQADEARKARGRWVRLKAAWRGER
jgi:chromosome segregation ATPase